MTTKDQIKIVNTLEIILLNNSGHPIQTKVT